MNELPPLFMALMLVIPTVAHTGEKQANISGAQTETHLSGASTPEGNPGEKIHASGATTSPPGKSTAGKAASRKTATEGKTGKDVPRNSLTVTHQFNDERPAPGDVRKPRQPAQATVEKPRSPGQPRAPELPRKK